MIPVIPTPQNISELFPSTVEQLKSDAQQFLKYFSKELEQILLLDTSKRTFINSALLLDRLIASFEVQRSLFYVIQLVHTEAAMRNEAQNLLNEYYSFSLSSIWQNRDVFALITYFKDNNEMYKTLSNEQRRYVDKMVDAFQMAGMHLPLEKQLSIKKIYQELGPLTLAFGQAISEDYQHLLFTDKELEGVEEQFLENLDSSGNNRYSILINRFNYEHITTYCIQEQTRKLVCQAYHNRAYPKNQEHLEKIRSLRFELAQLLGFSSYAEFELSHQMAKNSETVSAFLYELLELFRNKALEEKNKLTNDGFIKPWDIHFVSKACALEDESIAQCNEYFPFKHTLDQLFKLCKKLFALDFSYEPFTKWDESVFLVKVMQNNILIGSVILDLFSRTGKYTHARHTNIIPAVKNTAHNDHTKDTQALSIVIANIAPTYSDTVLLNHDSVITLFHEFGHALHALVGKTEIAYFSGTRVYTDFLEMPSQMLEEWLWDKETLKSVSKHYKTGEPLSDSLIDNLRHYRFANSGYWMERQIFLSLLSLEAYNQKDAIDVLYKRLYQETMSIVSYDEHDHSYASFTHIVTYGSKYYSYLWSQIYATDIFEYLHKGFAIDPFIGKTYTEKILKPGGSQEPLDMLMQFLARKPSIHTFARYIAQFSSC